MRYNPIINMHIIPLKQYFTNGITLIPEMFDVVFYAQIINAKWLFSSTIPMNNFEAFFVKFRSDITGIFDQVLLMSIHELR